MHGGNSVLERFLDAEGRITGLPRRGPKRDEVLDYLMDKFEVGRDYGEREVNELCNAWHTFGDCFLLRRELIDSKRLCRTRNGARYWRECEDEPAV